ncbi:amino acid adenylation domain-containing protein, partial [Mitsuaria sp. WAJ17]|uniref:non-ribosomal peptide synthetase n=1 Tax=Mitsuaria sp. WAJ17 TaxID=2761452 RepID=UPI0015FFC999
LGVSVASLCHLAYAQLLGRVSGREDVVFGTVLFGRMQAGAGADRALGLYINTLPLRVKLQGPVLGAVKQVQQDLAGLLRHEHAPLALAQRCSGLESGVPVFTALFNYRHNVATAENPDDTRLADFAKDVDVLIGEERTNYPFLITLDDNGAQLHISARVQAPASAARVCEALCAILQSLAHALHSASETPLETLDAMAEAERNALLAFGAAQSTFPAARGLHQVFAEQAQRHADRVALQLGDQTLHYADLEQQANRLAHALRQQGIGAESRVALCFERSFEMLIAILAVLKAGAAYVPLDPAQPTDRLRYCLKDSAPALLLTHSDVDSTVLEGLRAELTSADRLLHVEPGLAAFQHLPGSEPDLSGFSPRQLAYVIYTSGSTGQPKGVMVEHAQVMRLFEACQAWYGFGPTDVWTLFHTYAFDFSVWEIWGALLHGGRLVIVPGAVARDAESFHDLLCTQNVTILNQTPSAFRQLIAVQGQRECPHALREVIFGGEALELSALKPWYDRPVNARTRLVNMYGITETTVHVSYRPLSAIDANRAGPGPIGCPIPDLSLRLLDPQGRLAPIGVAGEIHVGGAGVARGYLNRPDLNEQRFLADPLVPGGRLYRSGDLARWTEEGELEYLGRNDHQVKVRGYRIELGEIEAKLLELPGIREAVVLAREEEAGHKRLVAYFVGAESGNAPDTETLRQALEQALPSYMVPSAFVRLDAMPLTANGKLDRRALPAPGGQDHAHRIYEAPQGEIEERIAELWADALQLPQVGRHDNFFELGGHSLLAVTLIERMRQAGLSSDVRALFSAPSLAQLARQLEIGDGGSRPLEVPPSTIPEGATRLSPDMLPLVQLTQQQLDALVSRIPGGAANVQDIYPLAPLQEGMLFHHLMGGEGDVYLLRAVLRFEQSERLDQYLSALQRVLARHDVLRTSLHWEGLDEPVQVVLREVTLPVQTLQAEALGVSSDAAGDEALQALLHQSDARRQRLPLQSAPLMQARVLREPGRDSWLMALLVHHIAVDHQSMDAMQQEILWELSGHGASLLPTRPFREHVAQARLGMSTSQHEAFFREQLSSVDEPTLPYGLSDVQGDGTQVGEAHLSLPEPTSVGLRLQARRLGLSLASLCHLAFAQVLGAVSGRDDVVFGTVLFGRMQGGAGQALGLYINTLPLRVRLLGQIRDTARKVQRDLAGLLRHEHASLSLAQRCSGLTPGLPLFSALLNYRHSGHEVQGRSEELDLDALQGVEFLHGEESSNYPFNMDVDDSGASLILTAQVAGRGRAQDVCALMAQALSSLEQALREGGQGELSALAVLPPAQEERLHGFGQPAQALSAELAQRFDECGSLHGLVQAQAQRCPQALALVDEQEQLSYAELDALTHRLAAHIAPHLAGAKEAKHEQPLVLLCLPRGAALVAGVIAVLKAGAAYVPADPAYPSERLSAMLRDSGARVVLTHGELEASAQARLAMAVAAQERPPVVLDVRELRQQAATEPSLPQEPQAGASALAYVIYTSGSTGTPKGVMVEHRQALSQLGAVVQRTGLSAQDRVLQFASVAFDVSVEEIFATLGVGATLVLRSDAWLQGAQAFWQRCQAHGITVADLPLQFWEQLIQQDEPIAASLRLIIIGGEALNQRALARWWQREGHRPTLLNAYGPTETTVNATIHEPGAGEEEWRAIGQAMANTRLYVLDAHRRLVPPGVVGELYIGGAGVAR